MATHTYLLVKEKMNQTGGIVVNSCISTARAVKL